MGWLVDLSPWLQVPIVLALALPPAGLLAWAGLALVDWVGGAVGTENSSTRVNHHG